MIRNKLYRAILLSLIAALPFLACQLVKAQSLSKSQSSSGYPGAPDIHPGLTQALQGGQNRTPLEKNLSLIGFLDLQQNPGTTSDVWAHGNFAYVGGFGGGTTVKVVDISDPTDPRLVTELTTPDGSSPQDVKVARINTKFFHGDLLAVANDFGNAPPPFGGIQLWDVTDPLNPVQLSAPRIAPTHNLFLFQKGNRAFVLLVSGFLEVASNPPSIFAPFFAQHMGDFVIVEVTDPANPQVIADWGAGKDGGFPFGFPFPIPPIGFPATCLDPLVCRGASASVFCHDVWVNTQGTVAYLSYWDLGLILLDISDPTNPTFIGRGIEPPTFGSDEGNLHVAVPAQGGNLVVVGDEDFAPGPWGFLRVFDSSDPSSPEQVGAFATPGALGSGPATATMHNIIVRGSRAYLSWYFEGISIVDISQPSRPREIASFIPNPAETSPGLFWGIYEHKDLILATDIIGGLFILKQEASGLLGKTGVLETAKPSEFALMSNYPNPFNPATEIRFQVPEASHVVVRIINTLGQEIRILADGQYETGYHNVRWDGKDNNGNVVSSGIYLYQLQAGSFSEIRKMTLLR